ncbi:tyramine oxidase subunit B [Aurantiacibacter suaedae]|uniref:tyramine oxidase subunit B n=1 Tax=Aurantiacibacter suaedae TaxID=2545755 RepID=UPI0010F58393|nr:tyramine oxidase subunit B [Aurantiacibacter suaedae]
MPENASSSAAIDFIYLNEAQMIEAGVTDMASCVDTMEEMFALLHRGDYRMPGANNSSHGSMITFPDDSPFPDMPKNTADRRFMAMPAYLGGNFGTSGVKWYGSNIANRERGLPRSILMFILNDTDTGAPLAFMSANLLSAYRTGAIPGVGARHLARHDSRVVGICGPGVMARTSLSAFMATCPAIDTLKVKGRGEKSLKGFLEWVAETFPQITTVETVTTDEEVVRDCDIVSFCQASQTGDVSFYPRIEREWVKPGAFFAMPAAVNFADEFLGADVRKVFDNTGLYEAWMEEVPRPAHNIIPLAGVQWLDQVEQGKLDPTSLEDLGAIVAGDSVARRNEDEIIILSVGGMPVEDVAWGTQIYRNAIKLGIGTKLNLWDQPALR